MDRYINNLRGVSQQATQGLAEPRIGIVSSYDPGGKAKVMYQPENLLSGWLPIAAMQVGTTAVMCGLTPGQQVVVIFQEGDVDHGIIVACVPGGEQPTPCANAIGGSAVAVQSGEIAIVGPNSSMLRLCADGSIFMKPGSGMSLNVDGPAHFSGNITSDQNVIASGGDINQIAQVFNEHIHQTPFGPSDPPTQQIQPQ